MGNGSRSVDVGLSFEVGLEVFPAAANVSTIEEIAVSTIAVLARSLFQVISNPLLHPERLNIIAMTHNKARLIELISGDCNPNFLLVEPVTAPGTCHNSTHCHQGRLP